MKYNLYDVIRRPIITEKSTMISEYRKYTFEVARDAGKELVKKAVESIFDVKVQKVNMLNVAGKTKRFKGIIGKQSDFKKAVVTLEKDNTIDLAGGVK
ncbi:MAG: 50S ribosomal protein L23 [Rickettsiaceae bacterium]|nr:50S ribosomal protein L23 [Rickettsiaceae bacterium]